MPGAVAAELIGPEEDVRPPEGMAALAGPPPISRGAGCWRPACRRRGSGSSRRAWRMRALGYEACMGVGTCLIAVEGPEDVERARALALGLGGHAQVVDGPDDLRADPWGPPPPRP